MHIRALCLLTLTLLSLTPPAWAQSASDAERQKVVGTILNWKDRHPDDPMFFSDKVTTRSAQGSGAGLNARGDHTDIKGFDAGAPTASAGSDTNSSGGGISADGLSAWTDKAKSPFLWFGLIFLAIAFYFDFVYVDPRTGQKGNKREALIFASLGIACIVAALVPTWAWISLTVGAVVVLGGYLYLAVTNPIVAARLAAKVAGLTETARAVVEGLENAPGEASSVVKASIRKAADPGDLEHLDAIRRADYPGAVL